MGAVEPPVAYCAIPAGLIPHLQHLRILLHPTKVVGTVQGLFSDLVLAMFVSSRLYVMGLVLIIRPMSFTGVYW